MKKVVPHDAILIPDLAERKFEGIIFDTYQWSQELFDGTTVTFEMLRRPDTVSVMCIVDGKILVLKDEQPHSGIRVNFPGGRVDLSDEDIETAAKREVHEETGYSFNKWKLLNVYQPQSKNEWFIHLYLAWDVVSVEVPHTDAGEKIDVEKYSFEEVKNLANDNPNVANEMQPILRVNSVEDLKNAPAFIGKEVIR